MRAVPGFWSGPPGPPNNRPPSPIRCPVCVCVCGLLTRLGVASPIKYRVPFALAGSSPSFFPHASLTLLDLGPAPGGASKADGMFFYT